MADLGCFDTATGDLGVNLRERGVLGAGARPPHDSAIRPFESQNAIGASSEGLKPKSLRGRRKPRSG